VQPLGAAYFSPAGIGLYGVTWMVKKNNLDAAGFKLQPVAVLQGTVVVLVLLFLASVVLALAVSFSPWQAGAGLLKAIAHLAVFAGAFWAGKKCARKAWLHGILVGLAAFILLGALGSVEQSVLSWLWWQRLLRMLFAAMLGGMVGGLFKSG